MVIPETKIVIRCALQSSGDMTVVCPHDWTILRLKQHLRDVYPSQPDPLRQKLIYAGQCLKDEDKIGGVLRSELVCPDAPTDNANHTFHLVYTPTVEQLRQQRTDVTDLRQRKRTTPEASQAASSVSPPPMNSSVQSEVPSAAHPYAASWWGLQTGFPTYGSTGVPVSSAADQGMGGHVPGDWMQDQQQMYNDYMINYVNYMNQFYGAFYGSGAYVNPAMGVSPLGIVTPPPASGAEGANTVPPAGDEQGLVAQQPAQPAAPAQGEAAMNAQGGFDEDDLRDRDWLDYVYMASRAGLLLAILYFYSSIERFVLVTIVCGFIYAVQNGWFGLRGPQAAEEPGEQQQQPADQAQQQEPEGESNEGSGSEGESNTVSNDGSEGQEVSNENAGANSNPGETENIAAVENPPPTAVLQDNRSAWEIFWVTCYTFITTFFTSMIPEGAPPVNVN